MLHDNFFSTEPCAQEIAATVRSVIDKVGELHPSEAAAALALLQDVCRGWNKLHGALEGNLAVGACNNTNKFDELEVDKAKLFLFVQLPGKCLSKFEPLNEA
jgi:hypothetical protein